MRKFKIINSYGEEIALQGGTIFLFAPSGFGCADKIEYSESSGYYIETHREQEQTEKTGTLIFSPTGAYRNYMEFANWVFAANGLTLAYCPVDTWYYVDVDIIRIEKGELTVGGVLEIPITLMPRSPVYVPYNVNLQLNGDTSDATKKYGYTYPYRYLQSAKSGAIEFTVAAQIPCDFSFSIPTPVSAPVVTVERADTETMIGKVDLSEVTTTDGDVLMFSTVPGRSGARIASIAGNTDLTELIGISTGIPTFFQLPPNVPLRITLSAASLVDVTMSISVHKYFRTV